MKLEYDLNAFVKKARENDSYFHTFINKTSLAAGVLVLKPGEHDTQAPHDSDEVYCILSGNGYLKIGGKNHTVSKDKLFFVAKGVKHYFHGNTRLLKVLYFFGGSDS